MITEQVFFVLYETDIFWSVESIATALSEEETVVAKALEDLMKQNLVVKDKDAFSWVGRKEKKAK